MMLCTSACILLLIKGCDITSIHPLTSHKIIAILLTIICVVFNHMHLQEVHDVTATHLHEFIIPIIEL